MQLQMMGVARPLRVLVVFVVLVLVLVATYLATTRSGSGSSTKPNGAEKDNFDNGLKHEYMLDPIEEPKGKLWRAEGDAYAVDNPNSNRINATLIALVRNEELDKLIPTMQEIERTFNSKFNYPWTFFNDKDFTADFKERTKAQTKANIRYEKVPSEHWDMPEWINETRYDEAVEALKKHKVQYADKLSYHQMCRWNSGLFYKHPALEDMQYYWRVEPNVHYYCDIDYDVFRFMQDNNKTYGFNINLYDAPQTVESLWPETMNFLAAHPEYLATNNAMDWLADNKQRPGHNKKANGYSTCHFWSNFEIGDLSFFRGEAYEAYFQHLDHAGGFFYERWGDAPVHSIGLGLFADKNHIHWFRDIGYNHIPYFNCPNSPKCKGCTAGKFYAGEPFLQLEDCRPNWFKYVGPGDLY
ncbi:hypothetical protein KEM52_006115 [Ascosphaera acerosa]|nr:hypothetical protein KEM52_006115 [Ascosphaera acerosa]